MAKRKSASVSLAWYSVAKAQNNRLARYFLQQGAAPGALFAAAWWGNADIIPDLVRHGADLNEVVGATPLHMAVDVVQRGVAGKPQLGRRRLTCVKEMLRLGANPNIPAHDGTTPLHTALKKEYLEASSSCCGTEPILTSRKGWPNGAGDRGAEEGSAIRAAPSHLMALTPGLSARPCQKSRRYRAASTWRT